MESSNTLKIRFSTQGGFKTTFQEASYDQVLISIVLSILPHCFASLSKKTVLTSSFKNLQKTEKWCFQTLRTFAFELKGALKPFSKKLPITKFRFKQFWTLCLTFPKMVSTSSQKDLQNIEKWSFQTLRTFGFDLKIP